MTRKAFVSSTFQDLKDHRAYVIKALRRAGIFVDPMENWTADTDAPKKMSQERVKGCDLFILLVARRRGHVPEGEDLGVTQLEYRAAVDLGIERFVFMLSDKASWNPEFDELDKDPGLRRWRDQLREERVVSEFDADPRSVEIQSALTRWALAQAPEVAAPEEIQGRHNLPFFPQSFVGRMGEGEKLHGLLHPPEPPPASGKRPWVAVKGMGGIGKSYFAAHYAWSHLGAFETVCWVNASGEDIAAAVAALAAEPLQLGLSENATTSERVAAVKRRLASGGPHLLVFDNVDHPASFVSFVPAGVPVHVLVTTRRDDLSEVDSILELGPVSEDEALNLLRGESALSPEEEQAARDLAERFGRLTLLLALAGRLMKCRSWWPSKLLARVGKHGPVAWSVSVLPPAHLLQVDPSLVNLFDASLKLLDSTDSTDAVARRFLFASGWLASAPIPPLLFQEMAVPQGDSAPDLDVLEDAIARLVNVGLATIETRPAVSVHALVAEFARLKGGDGPRHDAILALAGSVRGLVPNSFIVPYPGLGGLCLAELEPHLQKGLDLLEPPVSSAHGWIALRLAESLEAGGNASEAIRILERVGSLDPDDILRARSQAMLGRLYAGSDRKEEARQALEVAYPALRRHLEPCDTECIVAGVALAESLVAAGRPSDALALLHPLCESCGDPDKQIPGGPWVRKAAASILAETGRLEEALFELIPAMAIEAKGSGLRPLSYRIHQTAGNVFVETFTALAIAGDAAAIGRVLDRAAEVLGSEPNKDVVRANHEAGRQLKEQERYDEAVKYLKAAMAGLERMHEADDSDSGATHFILGETLLQLGRAKEAIDHLQRALSFAETLFEPRDWRINRLKELLTEACAAGT